ncbi:very short patch repair endonuclease [Nocardia sp. CDC186]|uniref:Very short patch repair endonuclease n=1 Tax=Nocardia implantans TaxID=3108168 RepID=A0ABU6AZ45_9NOCA|nr:MULTISPECIES: very short patch repair endonuclease [unclassified Nocardia]MBF6194152.1 very short patch repair endonuclease [Nocardia beijingensis]MEA3529760.1 very short patch repair endonuclease [Nocardia sp. CDC192]MEB3512762.1 very short patch repair endonuclease [Nocardia sp. CDC186]
MVETEKAGASWASTAAVRSAMRANRRRDTRPELAIRRLVHAAGLRYRVDYPPLKGNRRMRADLVFTRAKVAVFIDGCFWHGCPEHHRPSRTNAEFWANKISANRERDSRTNTLLRQTGWTVLRVWEHEAPDQAAGRIIAAVLEAR